MALSIFGEKAITPTNEMLAAALAERKIIWDMVTEHIENTYSKISGEWKFYSKSAGWSFVIKSEKRTLIYLIPTEDCIKTNFVFGERAVKVIEESDLPESLIKSVTEARAYMEGRSCMVDIVKVDDIEIIKKLLKIKSEN